MDAPLPTASVADPGPAHPAPAESREDRLRRVLLHAIPWTVVGVIVLIALVMGVRLRKWAYVYTTPIRFQGDITRGFRFGARAADEGYFDLYDKVAKEQPGGDYDLDYAPLRLWVMMHWAKATRQMPQYAGAREWQPEYKFTRPVLRFNTAIELITAVGVFLLVRLWVIRGRQPPSPCPGHFERWFRAVVLRRPPMPPLAATTAPSNPCRGVIHGLIAALLIWFSPAQILSSQCWPTWDAWVIPFYVFGVLLACTERWFAAGLVIGLGALFKGQQLFVAPLFVLWPLFSGKPGWILSCLLGVLGTVLLRIFAIPELPASLVPYAMGLTSLAILVLLAAAGVLTIFTGRWGPAVRWLAGFAFAFAVVVSPWLIADLRQALGTGRWSPLFHSPAMGWVGGAILAGVLLAVPAICDKLRKSRIAGAPPAAPAHPSGLVRLFDPIRTRLVVQPRLWCFRAAVLVPATVLLIWPWTRAESRQDLPTVAILAATAIVASWLLPLRRQGVLVAAIFALAVFACVDLFSGASFAWRDIGYGYGTRRYPYMIQGLTSNLPGLLYYQFRWMRITDIAWVFGRHELLSWPDFLAWPQQPMKVEMRDLLLALYAIGLLLASAGAAMQARRNDPRFLVAITAPWVLFFTIPAQIHERYLLYAAGVGAVLVAVNLGMVLLDVFMIVLTWAMTFHVMVYALHLRNWVARELPGAMTYQSREEWFRIVAGQYPGIGWAVLLCALLFLYVAIAPRRRWTRPPGPTLPAA